MGIPWFAVLKSVPWTDVINNAPKVTDGAKKLWNAIGNKTPAPEVLDPDEQPTNSSEAENINALQTKLATVETSVADLQEQMLASSELIKSLADQNTQLIKCIELNRVRVFWLIGVIVIFDIVAISSLVLTLMRYN